MGDVEDPYLYAAEPIWKWQQTDHGQWVMEHSLEQPVFYCKPDPHQWGYKVEISGELEDKDAVVYLLKYGQPNSIS